MDSKNRIDAIQQLCEKHGLNIYEVVREANVPESTVANWRRKNPKQFEAEDKILAAINKMVEEKNTVNSLAATS